MGELMDLGPGLPPSRSKNKNNNVISMPFSEDSIRAFKQQVTEELSHCTTRREVMEKEANKLAECSAIAIEVYRSQPIPDNAYMVSTLVNSHKAAIAQLNKMQDPKVLKEETNKVVETMFLKLIRALADEINKAKEEFTMKYPNERLTVEEIFRRMLSGVQPSTQMLFEDLNSQLNGVFGIKETHSEPT